MAILNVLLGGGLQDQGDPPKSLTLHQKLKCPHPNPTFANIFVTILVRGKVALAVVEVARSQKAKSNL